MTRQRRRPVLLAVLAAFMLGVLPVLPAPAAEGPSRGYWFVAADGGIFAYGDAAFHGSTGNLRLNQPIVGMAPTPTGNGYWFVAADGGIFSFGDAGFHGSTGNIKLNRPIVGMAPTPTGRGYWFVASDGGIFAFGDARFHGSAGSMRLAKPIVGMAATPSGKGYWFVASDGGVFTYGDAGFYGNAVGARAPIVGITASPSGKGYWLVGSAGDVFGFGDATFEGSMGGRPLALPVVGMTPTPSGNGYWLVATDGGIFSFGDAGFHGSTGSIKLNRPIVGMAAALAGKAPTSGGGGTSPTNPTTPGGGGGGGTTPTTPTTTPTTPTTTPTGPGIWGPAGTTTALPRGTGGSGSFRPWMSGDGRYVAYDNDQNGVVAGDTNSERDIFVYDRVANTTSLVTKGVGGAAANGQSQRPTLSADGRFVAFWSEASNLVEGDTNNRPDAFVHDRSNGTTKRVSVTTDGDQGTGDSRRPMMARNGRYVAFESTSPEFAGQTCDILNRCRNDDTNNAQDVFVHDLETGETFRVSVPSGNVDGQGDDESDRPSISADGQLVAFQSLAANLVTGDTNAKSDIFVHDVASGQTTRASAAADGGQANNSSSSPSLSADGRYVSFTSVARNLVGSDPNGALPDVYVKDRTGGAVVRVSADGQLGDSERESHDSSISGDGAVVAFWSQPESPAGSDPIEDIFVWTRSSGAVRYVSTHTDEVTDSFSPALSVDGKVVAFDSKGRKATGGKNSSDIFVFAL